MDEVEPIQEAETLENQDQELRINVVSEVIKQDSEYEKKT